MADRSVKVTVGANVAPLKAAMSDASRSVEGLTAKTTTLGQRLKSRAQFLGLTGGLLSLGAAIKGTFSLGLDFTTQLNTLQAVTGATGDQMTQVSAKAKQLGNDITIPGASASDAAQAMTELAKGGLSASQAMDAAKGTLQLAAAAQISGAQAATIQANALNTFRLKASDAGHVADVLANSANAANGEITDFAQAFQQVGSVAAGVGWSIDDTATALALLAKNGIIGSDAGTSIKTALLQMITPSKQAKAAIQALGLQVYDSSGNLISARDLADELSAAQKRMSNQAFQSAAGILFGSDAIRTATVFAREGAAGYDDMGKKIEKVNGVVDLANAKMKGLPGALQNLQNAAQNLALGLYQKLAPAVESTVNGLSDIVNVVGPPVLGVLGAMFSAVGTLAGWLGKLPGPIRDFGLALAGLAIANKVGLLSKLTGVFETIALKSMYAKDTLTGFKGTWSRLGDDAAMAGVSRMQAGLGLVKDAAGRAGDSILKAFGGPKMLGLGAGITVISAAISEFNREVHLSDQAIADNKTAIDNLAGAYKQAGGAVTQFVRQQAFGDIQKNSPQLISWAKAQGISMHELTDAYLGLPSGDDVRAKLSAWGGKLDTGGTNALARTIVGAFVPSAQKATDTMQGWSDQITLFLGTAKAATQQNADMADAVDGTTSAMKSAKSMQSNYVAGLVAQHNAINSSVGAYVDMSGAQSNYISQLEQQHAAAIQTTGATIDLSGVMRSLWRIDLPGLKKAMADTGFATLDLNTAANTLISTMQRLAGRNVDAEQATSDFQQSLDDLVQQAKGAKGSIQQVGLSVVSTAGKVNLGTERGRQLNSTLNTMSSSALTLATAMAQTANKTGGQNAAARAAFESTKRSRAEFIKQAAQLGIVGKRAQNLADKYGLIPSRVSTTVRAEFQDANVKKALNALTKLKVVIPIEGQYSGASGTPAHGYITAALASGGPVGTGRYLVGEKGPELLTLAPGSRGFVTPNSGLVAALSAPSGSLIPRAQGGSVAGAQSSGHAGSLVVDTRGINDAIRSGLESMVVQVMVGDQPLDAKIQRAIRSNTDGQARKLASAGKL